MWQCTDGIGMICLSFDTTGHYLKEHNMIIEKRDRALLVKLFYLNGRKKWCCIEEISPRERNQKRTNVNEWVKGDDDEIREHW